MSEETQVAEEVTPVEEAVVEETVAEAVSAE